MKKLCLVLAATILLASLSGCGKKVEDAVEPTEAPIVGNTYYAPMNPVNKAEVYSEGKGKIIVSNFKVGDTILAGDLLYQLDDNGLYDNIKTTKNSLKKADISIGTAQENVSNLTVYAPSSGILKSFDIKDGERVNTGTIGKIVDESIFTAKIPFNETQIQNIRIGDSAAIISADLMSNSSAKVTRIYDSRSSTIGGSALYDVELTGNNPGGFSDGLTVNATVYSSVGEVASPVSGQIKNADSVSVVSRGSGNASAVYVKEGEYVKKGQKILTIDNTNVGATLSRAKLDRDDLQIKLNALEKDAADLYVYSPISGMITEKKKELHDSISTSSDSVMTISDVSVLNMELKVSDDDFTKLSAGQSIDVKYNDTTVQGMIDAVSDIDNSVHILITNDVGIAPETVASVTIGGDR